MRSSRSAARVAAIDVLLGNPFTAGRGERAAARRALDDDDDLRGWLDGLVAAGEISQAKRAVLAIAVRQAVSKAAARDILGAETVSPKVLRALPRKRNEYVALATAAGRAYHALGRIRGSSEAIREARRDTWAACFGVSLVHALDLTDVIVDHDVLILGETGTGKELFASAMQEALTGGPSGAPAPRSAINAAAIPDTLVESELFGHIKGAFTGATETRAGRLRSADGGSFFLDEIGDLPMTTQVKLLRVMETNEVFPLGADAAHHVQVRYITATHKDLEGMVARGEFRRDLFERMAGSVLRIPPLRDRPEDIVEIGRHFVASYVRADDEARLRPIMRWLSSSEARTHRWAGNVRELQNALRNLLLGLEPGLSSSEVDPSEAPADLPASIAAGSATLETVEDWYVRRVLADHDGNYSRAAQVLGVDRSTVRRRTLDDT